MEDSIMIEPKTSLVKYENAVLMNEKEKQPATPKFKTAVVSVTADGRDPTAMCATPDGPMVDSKQELDEVLDSIVPPLEWQEEGGIMWRQRISSTPATRTDVLDLQQLLDRKLEERQAREAGICPVRRELYSQLFDELIRQVTVNCVERGLLLLRVRDELRMTMYAYQTLYESSCAYGMRKALQSEHGKQDLQQQNEQLTVNNQELQNQLSEMAAKCEQIEQRSQEIREADERRHLEEVQFLKRSNQRLKTQLESIIAPKK